MAGDVCTAHVQQKDLPLFSEYQRCCCNPSCSGSMMARNQQNCHNLRDRQVKALSEDQSHLARLLTPPKRLMLTVKRSGVIKRTRSVRVYEKLSSNLANCKGCCQQSMCKRPTVSASNMAVERINLGLLLGLCRLVLTDACASKRLASVAEVTAHACLAGCASSTAHW